MCGRERGYKRIFRMCSSERSYGEIRGREQHFEWRDTPHPGGDSDGYQTKGVAEKGIRKTMKTKSRKTVDVDL